MGDSRSLVVIPARMASSRLPGKPLADISGKPMIVRVWERACRAHLGPVVVACADRVIAGVIEAAGGRAVWIEEPVPRGSDIVYQVAERLDPHHRFDIVLNVQGDLPVFDSGLLRPLLIPLEEDSSFSMTTPVIRQNVLDDRLTSPHVVKVAFEGGLQEQREVMWGRAVGFSRNPEAIYCRDAVWYQHVGVYAYRRSTLRTYVEAPQSPCEQEASLEQLRALYIGLRIAGVVVDIPAPLSVDTPEDLEQVRAVLKQRSDRHVA